MDDVYATAELPGLRSSRVGRLTRLLSGAEALAACRPQGASA
jgi:hypothetical protein